MSRIREEEELMIHRCQSVSELPTAASAHIAQFLVCCLRTVGYVSKTEDYDCLLTRGGPPIGAGGVMPPPTFRGKGGRGDIIWE